MEIPL